MKKTTLCTFAIGMIALLTATLAQAGWPEGTAAFKAGNLSAAATEFKAVVDAQPEWPGGHFMYGWTLSRQKKTDQAIVHLRKAYDLDKANENYKLRLGEAYVNARRYSDAVGFLSKINAAGLPKDLQGLLSQLKAVAYSKSGQTGRALTELAKAAQAKPNDANLQFQWGAMAMKEGDMATAIRALEKAAQLDSGDMEKQRAVAQAHLKVGRTTRGSGKVGSYQKAAAAARKVVARDASFDNLMLLGGAQLGAKDYNGAISTFQQASTKSSDWLPLYYIGQAHTATGAHGSAENALKSALNNTTDSDSRTKVWKQLGFVYEKQKDYSKAIDAYNRAGDSGGATRVAENRDTEKFNRDVEQENRQIRELEEEKRKLEEELKQLPGGNKPGRP
ncbi:MAG: tetratricopeptide repeat protein [Acidobacteriota bacterium]|nr:tetratricopeptide repeat protein [Acidobacteriota bacterium]